MPILHVLEVLTILCLIIVNPSGKMDNITATRIILNEGVRLLAIGEGSAWGWNPTYRTIEQVDLSTGEPSGRTISLDFEPLTGSVESGSLWLCSQDVSQLVRIDLSTYRLAAIIDISAYVEAWEFITVVTGEGTIWIKGQETVFQIDPETNHILGKPIAVGEEAIVATVAQGELWVGSHDDGLLTRIDAQTQKILTQFDVGFSIHGLAIGNGSIWVLDEHRFRVVELDLVTNAVKSQISIDFVSSNIVFAHGSLWIAPAAYDSGRALGNDAIVRIDPQAPMDAEEIHVKGDYSGDISYYLLLVDDGDVWVSIESKPTMLVKLAANVAQPFL